MGLIITILPVVTKDLPISPRFTPYDFLSRCNFSALTTRQPMVEFYLLTFPRFLLRKKEHKSYFGKNRTHDFRISRCAGYLLLIDHSGDDWAGIFPTLVYSGMKCFGTVVSRQSALPRRWVRFFFFLKRTKHAYGASLEGLAPENSLPVLARPLDTKYVT